MATISYVLMVISGMFVAFLTFIIATKALYDMSRAVLWVWSRLRGDADR